MSESSIQYGLRTTTRCLLALFLLGLCSRGIGFYNQTLKETPQVWMDVVRGTASAPEQYRIGIVQSAYWLTQHLVWSGHRPRLNWVFGAFDLLGAVSACFLLLGLLESTQTYRKASLAAQWFGSAGFVALALYALDWTFWYQKVGTLPSAGLVALMAWLWSPPANDQHPMTPARSVLTVAALLLLVALQSFIRADLALTMCLGVLAANAMGLQQRLSLSRRAAIATSALGMTLSAVVQFYLSKKLYPNANYGGVPIFMLPHDYRQWVLWASCLIFLAPLLWTVTQVLRQRYWGEGASASLLLAALFHLLLWVTMGRLDEVRIFLPMALVTLPLTLEIAMQRISPVFSKAKFYN